jgi:predicted ester cyclase
MQHDKTRKTTFGLVQAFYERIWNAGDTGATVQLLDPDFIFRGSLGAEMRGRDAFCRYVRSVRSALDSYRCDILDCVTEGERAFAKMRFCGIHVGQFRGFAPTHKSVQWLGAALFRVEGPLIAELWVLGDLVSLEANLKENAAG